MKKRIEVGDKLCGRYANKGVISSIHPVADMPYLEDGRPLDMILNPIGILSRMNLGQILETTMGYAVYKIRSSVERLRDFIIADHGDVDAHIAQIKSLFRVVYNMEHLGDAWGRREIENLNKDEIICVANDIVKHGIRFEIPQFCEMKDEEITKILESVGCNSDGKEVLIDGQTGERFLGKVLIGYEFIMKLCHMVSSKLHARSTGPYSLVTLQPLGGKQRGGGQRFGEMETWALQGHGAAYSLNELLTFKSDDPEGRKRVFNLLVSGKPVSMVFNPILGSDEIAEGFKLLLREIRALCFDIEVLDEDGMVLRNF